MITNLLAKFLHPHQQPLERKREARALLMATAMALVVAGIIGLVIIWKNHPSNF